MIKPERYSNAGINVSGSQFENDVQKDICDGDNQEYNLFEQPAEMTDEMFKYALSVWKMLSQ